MRTEPVVLSLLPREDAERQIIRESRAPATQRAYDLHWRAFEEWYGDEPPVLPCDPVTVAHFLGDYAETKAVATVRLAKASIGAQHRESGVADPTATEIVKRRMATIARLHGRRQKQAKPITEAEWERLRPVLEGHPMALALCLVMKDALLRISEAVALRWEDVDEDTVFVRRGKTDQEAEGRVGYLGPEARKALADLDAGLNGTNSRVFPVSLRTAQRWIGRAVQAAEFGPGYSGHSFRVGTTVELVRRGAGLLETQQAGGWKSSRMPARYAEGELARRGAVARLIYGETR